MLERDCDYCVDLYNVLVSRRAMQDYLVGEGRYAHMRVMLNHDQ